MGNYTLFTDNVVTSAGYKDADDQIRAPTRRRMTMAAMISTLMDNIITHLADPNNPDELARKGTDSNRLYWTSIDTILR